MKNKEIEEIFNTKLYFDLEEEDYIKIKNYIEQLENNRDKAIELLDRMYTDFEVMDSYNILSGDKEKLIDILMRGYLKDLKAGGRPMTDKELADHYKHLYSEVKKQKDDVVKVLKALKHRILYEEDFCINDYIDDDFIDVLLRMLGEIE